MTHQDLINELTTLRDEDKIKILSRFFKTGKGQYGEGDIFLGINVPQTRAISSKYKDLELDEIEKLLHSDIHEIRLSALIIMVLQSKKSDQQQKKKLYEFYLKNTKWINNWDLIDLSAEHVVGGYLIDKTDKSILEKLAKSDLVWDRRIAIMATFQFIKNKQYQDTFKIAEILLQDKHDLIQKAVGWMLREIGKKINKEVEQQFLHKHYKQMPRTMLRYAIEHFTPTEREQYLKGLI